MYSKLSGRRHLREGVVSRKEWLKLSPLRLVIRCSCSEPRGGGCEPATPTSQRSAAAGETRHHSCGLHQGLQGTNRKEPPTSPLALCPFTCWKHPSPKLTEQGTEGWAWSWGGNLISAIRSIRRGWTPKIYIPPVLLHSARERGGCEVCLFIPLYLALYHKGFVTYQYSWKITVYLGLFEILEFILTWNNSIPSIESQKRYSTGHILNEHIFISHQELCLLCQLWPFFMKLRTELRTSDMRVVTHWTES